MSQNDFKPFAIGSGANVTSQADWEALSALATGFQAGKASSAQVNKAIRQASFIAAAVAQFVSDKNGADVLDDGDLPGFVTDFISAVAVQSLTRANPFADIKADGTVETALENLGLGASAFGFKNSVSFTAPGVVTWNVPDEIKAGRKCWVRVIGGGGSGGVGAVSSGILMGGGGGGGGISEALLDLTGVSTVTLTIGGGGAAVTGAVSDGYNGSSSSFGSYISATGGGGGGQPSGGDGGLGLGGLSNSSLGPGSPGSLATTSVGTGGSGGGPGGRGQHRDSSDNQAAGGIAPGGGGAGLAPKGTNGKSGAGQPGAIYIFW
ncbi:hypothetical protein ML321_18125 [Escherichia coli]|nr:hypothetical protein [Escherichia coli]MCH4636915.1 hypothetical protein [Escherichia coli]